MRQARTQDQVLDDTLALLPEGFASTHNPDTFLGARFRPFANEIANVETSALALLPEVVDPRSADVLLPDWEAEMDTAAYLGDPANFSTATRVDLVFALLTQGAPVCAGDFERLALLIGETISITEMPATVCGRSFCGDTLNPPPGQFTIIVNLPSADVSVPTCGLAECGDFLGQFETSIMQPIIQQGVPLGVVPTFSFTGV
jgi:uncharacterized protein YmfQ (DUF2313 family)